MTDDLLRRFADLNPVPDPDRLVTLEPPPLPGHPALRALLERGEVPEHQPEPDLLRERHGSGHHEPHRPHGRTPDVSTTQLERTPPPRHDPSSRRRVLAGSLAAGLALLAGGIGIVASIDRTPTEPAEPTPVAPPDTPVELATALVEAYAVGDLERADGYLADDADLSGFSDGLGDMLTVPGLREAVRFELLLDSCRESATAAVGARVNCYFDYHSLGSRELGFDPFGGSRIGVRVSGDQVTAITSGIVYVENDFSRSVWEPFAAWIAEEHPDDVPVMYRDDQTAYNTTPEAVALWEARVSEYVELRRSEADAAG